MARELCVSRTWGSGLRRRVGLLGLVADTRDFLARLLVIMLGLPVVVLGLFVAEVRLVGLWLLLLLVLLIRLAVVIKELIA